ncbi:hypothetical protein FisN_25Lh103 [Fistulifera solaris]|uniref:Uncharacterized protein n=1 Tax=Fistulifera solaris TaxID=1519565 RepID=A0A1Z5J7X9_FISSO|nr:hypothetical protein FisN_25Lh103 [Fistulifera solaris]|eukprot:GAX10046.1 hypothetical protein FisN_25Lh103 [Fistulifera solaris]
MSLLIPPSTGKKKARARRVFGTSLIDGLDGSLCYSYSEDESRATSLATNKSENVSKSFLHVDQSTDSENRVNDSTSSNSSFCEISKKTSFNSSKISVHGPFGKIIESDQGKVKSATPTKIDRGDSRIQERLRVMRIQNIKSPVRRNLVKATQDAINQAAISVNQSLRAAHVSKVANHVQVTSSIAQERQGWKANKADAKKVSQLAHKARLQAISLEKELSSHLSRDRAKRRQNERSKKLHQIEKETEFKSQSFRDQQQRLKEDKEHRHRKSMAARALLRANYRQGKRKLQLQRIEEEKAIFEERHEASAALRQFTQDNNEKRRKSFAFRNGDARRIRELHAQLEAQRLHDEHQSFELKRAGDKDAEAYKRKIEELRRESLASRNAEARKQREILKDMESENMMKEHKSYELKWAGEKDAEAYQTKLEEERRKSLAFRGDENRKQRQIMSESAENQARIEHESYELKWSGERDAEAYQRKQQEERRQSLEKRNAFAKKQREQIAAVATEALHHEHESYVLKWSGEKDAELYLENEKKKRRDSLVFRNNEGRRIREFDEKLYADMLASEHQSYSLKWDGERDAKAYELRLASERRESLQNRNSHSRKQRVLAAEMSSLEAKTAHASYELKWAAEKDAENYTKRMQQERRESLAFRNRERERHANVMAELRSIALEKEHESYALKWAGERDAKDYLTDLEQQRRQSLQLRGKQKMHEREIQNLLHDKELKQNREDEELRAADQREVQQYRNDCAARDRASLEFRRKEARAQKITEQIHLIEQQAIDSKNFLLECDAHRDVEEYLKDCKRRRRLSLAFRAKERRLHSQWQQKKADETRQQISDEVQGRLLDRHYIELAQHEERTRLALKSIRSARTLRKTHS